MNSEKFFGITDNTLFICIVFLSFFGLVLLYSATNQNIDVVFRQGSRLIFCFVLMFLISFVDINKIKSMSPYVYLLCILMLIVTLLWGHDVKGAKRWIVFFGFSFQVSEILKIIVPMTLAWYLSLSEDKEIDLKKLIISFSIIFAPILFVIKQPDLGTSLIILLCGVITIFLGGITKKHIIYLLTLFSFAIPIMWKFILLPYQKQRIMTLFDPNLDPLGSGYHIIQSKIAVGSGGLFGKGFLKGTQSYLEFLPEKHTDFIFTLFSEEFGFIGSAFLLIIYAIIIYRIVAIGATSRSFFAKIFCYSFGAAIFVFITINMSMVLGLLPIVGSPLPIMSYGGSSMLATMVGFGIVMSAKVHSQQSIA